MSRLDGFIGRTRGERIGVAIMWLAILALPVLGPHVPALGHVLYWFFAPFRDHLSGVQ
jgi:hypothetical protein